MPRKSLPAIISYHIFKMTSLKIGKDISNSFNTFKEAHTNLFPPSYSMQSAMSPMSSSAMNSYNSFSTNNMMSSSISAAM